MQSVQDPQNARICGNRTHVEIRVLGHHSLNTDADTLDNGEQTSTRDGTVSCGFETASDGERAAGEEAGYYCMVKTC